MEGRHFLEELWEDKADTENPLKKHHFHHEGDIVKNTNTDVEEESASEYIDAYLDIKNISETDNNTRLLFTEIQKSLVNYIRSIDILSKSRLNEEDKVTMERNDHNRRYAHDALISSLNALSRYCAGHKIDNNWRRVVGISREDVTIWAKAVIDIALKDIAQTEK
jgi:hypothetical protein